MIENRKEYQQMYELERRFWWYLVLHDKILQRIRKHVGDSRNIKVLDAACGTGGLLSFLKDKGYRDISGFDLSPHALDFAQSRDLDVSFGDLKKPEDYRPGEHFDVICCSDALYFLDDREIVNVLQHFRKRLKRGGIIIINIHAFEAFSGTHDLAVGSARRFTLDDFSEYARKSGLSISYKTYWPFLLSLPIWIVRRMQRRKIRKGNIKPDSDLHYPGNLANALFGTLTAIEGIVPSLPFGSSLFLVLS